GEHRAERDILERPLEEGRHRPHRTGNACGAHASGASLFRGTRNACASGADGLFFASEHLRTCHFMAALGKYRLYELVRIARVSRPVATALAEVVAARP